MKEQITGRQGLCIMTMFIVGSSLIVGPKTEAGIDSWLAILIAMVAAVPFIFIYARMKKLQPDKDLYDIFQWIFGTVIGKIFIAIYAIHAFYLCSIILRNFLEFIQVESFPQTPQFVVAIFMGLTALYAVKSGMETIGRWSTIFLVMVIAVTVMVMLFGIPLYKTENLTPIAYKGIMPLLDGGLSILSYPFTETLIFSLALSTFKPGTKVYKVYYGALGIAAAFLVSGTLRDVMILGGPTNNALYHPSYLSTSVIFVGSSFYRFEVVIGMAFLLCGLVKITICMLATTKGVAKLFNIADHKKIAAPVAVLIMLMAVIIYGSTMENFDGFVTYKYYSIPFQLIIPPIIWVIAEIKTRRERRVQAAPKPETAKPEGSGPAY